jgi:hypothetical protein
MIDESSSAPRSDDVRPSQPAERPRRRWLSAAACILFLSGCGAKNGPESMRQRNQISVRVENQSWDYQKVRIYVESKLVKSIRLDGMQTRVERIFVPNDIANAVWAEFEPLAGGPPKVLPQVLISDGRQMVIKIHQLATTSEIIVR